MYICPVCKNELVLGKKTWRCCKGHCFDIHRKGYVNLLTTKKHNPKKSGDNGDMVRARTEFLNFGHYEPLVERTVSVMKTLLEGVEDPVIIDSGCGEGYYTVSYAKAMPGASFFGIDISKGACSHAMSRVNELGLENVNIAVASAFELPFEDGSADLVVCTFAPVSDREYARVLKRAESLWWSRRRRIICLSSKSSSMRTRIRTSPMNTGWSILMRARRISSSTGQALAPGKRS